MTQKKYTHPDLEKISILDLSNYLDGLIKELEIEEEARNNIDGSTLPGLATRIYTVGAQIQELLSTRLRKPKTRPYNQNNGEDTYT